jgi:hypothetical protein
MDSETEEFRSRQLCHNFEILPEHLPGKTINDKMPHSELYGT